MTLTRFLNASMSLRFGFLSVLAFCFTLLPVDASAEFGSADSQRLTDINTSVSDIKNSVLDIETGVNTLSPNVDSILYDTTHLRLDTKEQLKHVLLTNGTILRRLIELQRAVEPMRDYNGNFVLNTTGLSHSDNLLYNSWRTMNASTNISQWLFGSPSWNPATHPRFSILALNENFLPRPGNTVLAQNLTTFLTFALGGNFQYAPGNSSWEDMFKFDSVFNDPGTSGVTPGKRFFTIWLAEALRRIIANQQSTNVVQAVFDPYVETILRDISNAVQQNEKNTYSNLTFTSNISSNMSWYTEHWYNYSTNVIALLQNTNGLPEVVESEQESFSNSFSSAQSELDNFLDNLPIESEDSYTNRIEVAPPQDRDNDFEITDDYNFSSLSSVFEVPELNPSPIIPWCAPGTLNRLANVSGISFESGPQYFYVLGNDELDIASRLSSIMDYFYGFIFVLLETFTGIRYFRHARAALSQVATVPKMTGF